MNHLHEGRQHLPRKAGRDMIVTPVQTDESLEDTFVCLWMGFLDVISLRIDGELSGKHPFEKLPNNPSKNLSMQINNHMSRFEVYL